MTPNTLEFMVEEEPHTDWSAFMKGGWVFTPPGGANDIVGFPLSIEDAELDGKAFKKVTVCMTSPIPAHHFAGKPCSVGGVLREGVQHVRSLVLS